ncbi:hypothetical protein ANOM_008667 [Aspergillus nomiae NRRL 13137]|uniref:EamA domain-containing protein n=1 Tax=Aspergillus nomiae NRRL (strain ATCC 15546 / NRRL 13137 / CBS 260.88 / M93) TaxID=1509407 RepID=A0A0L1IRP0_ASPN3|nr:uncharacterized protein ANOM_008667 [Aspergillus nomiae NRRL 13137]KNG82256.1 hypothetical protein ANOM_008667 [Aspergillus nomiae NRRL 13137]
MMPPSASSQDENQHPGEDVRSDPRSVFSAVFGWGRKRHTTHEDEDERRPLLGSSSPMPSSPSSSSWWGTTWDSAQELWLQGRGMILVMLAQFFGASMNVMTQILERKGRNGEGFHPFQILFARMSITVLVSYLYMWYTKVPHPFGTRPVLHLLLLRAAGGFVGVYGLYYSVQYLPLSEATVLTFLAPILTCYACSLFIPNETFTRKQQLAGVVSLVGVVLIARPFSLFSKTNPPDSRELGSEEQPDSEDEYHRILATAMALMGVMGASCAYSTIRMIGQRCHPLVSVTYFSFFTTVVSTVAILVLPSIALELPGTPLEWTLLLGLGVCGFLLQFLLTAGLSYVPPPRKSSTSEQHRQYGSDGNGEPKEASRSSSGSRATSMIYMQMVFALFYDRVVWGSTLSLMSWMGSGLILGSAIYVAVVREAPAAAAREDEDETN